MRVRAAGLRACWRSMVEARKRVDCIVAVRLSSSGVESLSCVRFVSMRRRPEARARPAKAEVDAGMFRSVVAARELHSTLRHHRRFSTTTTTTTHAHPNDIHERNTASMSDDEVGRPCDCARTRRGEGEESAG